jgi:hypothetical protein
MRSALFSVGTVCKANRRGFATAKFSRFETDKTINYATIQENLEKWRKATDTTKPLTLAEKILYAHLDDAKQKVCCCVTLINNIIRYNEELRTSDCDPIELECKMQLHKWQFCKYVYSTI